jgi:hypothetical protein
MSFKEAAFIALTGFLKCLDKPILDFLNHYKMLWNLTRKDCVFCCKILIFFFVCINEKFKQFGCKNKIDFSNILI